MIIESGDYYKKKYKKVFSKYLKIKLKSRAFTVGGSSSIWSNISSYFEEFEMRSRWNNKSKNIWPLNHYSLTNSYKKVNNKFNFFYNKLRKKNFEIPFEVRPFVGSINPLNFKKYIDDNEIDIIYNCNINSIDEYQKIILAYTAKDRHCFRGKKLIVCCGGIETINLIQNSIYKKRISKIKNKNIIGKFFMDHPKFNLGYIKYPKIELIKNLELVNSKLNIFYYGISLKRNFQKKNKLLNSYIRFEKSSNKFIRILSKINMPILKNFIKKRLTYKVRLFCEMSPNMRNSVELRNKKTFVKLRFSEIDIRTIKILSNQIKSYFSYYPNREKNLNINNMNSKIEDASHHMGGLIYNPNKNLSNVDKNLKIMGLKNIYVCSSAVFPSSGSVNPTMTICALSVRLAKHLTE